MDDIKIKKIIKDYKENKEDIKALLEELSSLIINFPKIGFSNFNEDICSEFYVYIIERLPRIINSYDEKENVTFKTFFFLVLRRHYLNFIKQFNKKQNKEKLMENSYDIVYDEDKALNLPYKDIIKIFSSLNVKMRLFLKLRFPQFLIAEDFFDLSKEFNKEPTYFLDNIDIIMKSKVPVPPRVIAEFLKIDVKIVSKILFNIKEKIKEFLGDNYASF